MIPSSGEASITEAAAASRSLSASQARRAAVPFRSVLAEAAVGEVLGIFSVEAGITRTVSIGTANASATIWAILE